MKAYYFNKKIRVITDAYNFIPEVFCKGKTRTKNEDGKMEVIESTEEKWRRLGYYPTMEGAINGILRIIPVVIAGDDKEKAKDSLKSFLKVLKELKASIKVEIINGLKEEDLNDGDLEEEKIEKPKRKRNSKKDS